MSENRIDHDRLFKELLETLFASCKKLKMEVSAPVK